MLDLGFREDMEFILEATPEERRTLLFSATLPRGIVAWPRSISNRPFASKSRATRAAMPTSSTARSGSRPAMSSTRSSTFCNSTNSPSALVFCNTREAVRHLQATLLERGFSVVALSANRPRTSEPRRCRPCVTAVPVSAWRPMSRRGHRPAEPRSRHPRRYPERSGGDAASLRPRPAARAARASASFWCRRRASAVPRCC